MKMQDFIQIILFLALLVSLAPLLGRYMAKVFMGEKHILKQVFGWLERGIYRLAGINMTEEMNWKTFTFSLLIFNISGLLFLFLLQFLQAHLPLNPEKLPNVSWHLIIQYGSEFRDQYQLAVIQRRKHNELPGANAWPYRTEFC